MFKVERYLSNNLLPDILLNLHYIAFLFIYLLWVRVNSIKTLWVFIKCMKTSIMILDAILPRKGLITRAMNKRLQEDWARAAEEGPRVLMNLRIDFWAHGPRLGQLIFVHIRLGFHYFWALYLGLHNIGRVSYKFRIFQPLYFRAPRLVFVLGKVL